MNSECKTCWSPSGPNCRYQTGPFWSSITGTSCTKYPGLSFRGGFADCSYYKPATFWDDFWIGVSTGAFVGSIVICLVVLVWFAMKVIVT